MIRLCSYYKCNDRRPHYDKPDDKRGRQKIEVDNDWPLDKPVYCSITCAVMDGAIKLKDK